MEIKKPKEGELVSFKGEYVGIVSSVDGNICHYRKGEDSLKEPGLYPDPTFYPSSVVAELAKANCVDVYGPEGVTVKKGELAI